MTGDEVSARCDSQKKRISRIAALNGYLEVYFGTRNQPDGLSVWVDAKDGDRAEFPEPTSIDELERMSDSEIEAKIRAALRRPTN
jgi:hypothetical protein